MKNKFFRAMIYMTMVICAVLIPLQLHSQKVAFIASDVIRENFTEAKQADQRIKTMVEDNKKRFEERNIQLKKAYPFGKSFIGKVISYKQGLGVNVEIGPNIRGLIKERYDHQLKECQPGLEIKVVTIGFDEIRGKFYLELDKLN